MDQKDLKLIIEEFEEVYREDLYREVRRKLEEIGPEMGMPKESSCLFHVCRLYPLVSDTPSLTSVKDSYFPVIFHGVYFGRIFPFRRTANIGKQNDPYASSNWKPLHQTIKDVLERRGYSIQETNLKDISLSIPKDIEKHPNTLVELISH